MYMTCINVSSINIIGGVVSSSKDLDDLMTCCFAQHVSHKRSSVPVYAGLYIVFGFGSPCILGCCLRSFPSFLHARLHLQVWKCPKGAFERNIQGHNSIVNCLDLGFKTKRVNLQDSQLTTESGRVAEVLQAVQSEKGSRAHHSSSLARTTAICISGTVLAAVLTMLAVAVLISVGHPDSAVPTPIHHPCSTGLEKWPQVSELGGRAETRLSPDFKSTREYYLFQSDLSQSTRPFGPSHHDLILLFWTALRTSDPMHNRKALKPFDAL